MLGRIPVLRVRALPVTRRCRRLSGCPPPAERLKRMTMDVQGTVWPDHGLLPPSLAAGANRLAARLLRRIVAGGRDAEAPCWQASGGRLRILDSRFRGNDDYWWRLCVTPVPARTQLRGQGSQATPSSSRSWVGQ